MSELSSNSVEAEDPVKKKTIDLLSNIYGDSARYLQIIVNFLSNAVKFTKNNGEITIRLSVLESQEIKKKVS